MINDLVEIFCCLVEWDKNMHIAALEGKDVQELIDISEEILEHPMIAFDASFDVLAYTRHSPSHYKIFSGNGSAGIHRCAYDGTTEKETDFFTD